MLHNVAIHRVEPVYYIIEVIKEIDTKNIFFYTFVYKEEVNMDTKLSIGNQLKCIRWKKCWSQAFVCRQTGISIRTLSRIENGGNISKKMLMKLCDFYQIPISFVYMKQEEPCVKNVDLIPETVVYQMLQGANFMSNIQRETILRFNDCIQKEALMMREDVEAIIPEVITQKKSYTLADLVMVCMAVNQKTITNISQIAIA